MFMRRFMNWFLSIVFNAFILLVVAEVFVGFVVVDFPTAFLTSVVMSILNTFVRPILLFLTLPITIITFGISIFIVNTGILMLASNILSPDFQIDGFGLAFLASIIIAVMNIILRKIIMNGFRGR